MCVSQAVLAPHDLRNPLVAHPQHFSDSRHRQARFVGRPDRLVAVGPQLLTSLIQLAFSPRVLLCDSR